MIVLFCVACVGILWLVLTSSTWLWIDKYSRTVGSLVLPWSHIINIGRYHSSTKAVEKPALLLPKATFNRSDQKTVIVLVIGESARAENFSLYNYSLSTNPRLTDQDVIVLPNAQACATYTTAALRCILSHKENNSEFSPRFEPLPSYLHRHGVGVIWRTGNWGEPHLEVGEYTRGDELASGCTGKGCAYDEVLLNGLLARIKASNKQRVFVVLHKNIMATD